MLWYSFYYVVFISLTQTLQNLKFHSILWFEVILKIYFQHIFGAVPSESLLLVTLSLSQRWLGGAVTWAFTEGPVSEGPLTWFNALQFCLKILNFWKMSPEFYLALGLWTMSPLLYQLLITWVHWFHLSFLYSNPLLGL